MTLDMFENTDVKFFYDEAVKRGQKEPIDTIWTAFIGRIKEGSTKNSLGDWRKFVMKYGSN